MAGYKILFESDSSAIDTDDFIVTKVTGHDWMSRPYHFDIELVSSKPDIDLQEVLKNRAKLTIKQGYEVAGNKLLRSLNYFGIASRATQTGKSGPWFKYSATLVPEVMKLARVTRSRVFQGNESVKVITNILDEYNIKYDVSSLQSAFDGDGDKESKDYFVVQYNETDFDFISRWLEHEGIYYYWVQDDGEASEIMYFGDTDASYGQIPGLTEPFKYDPQQEAGAGGKSNTVVLTDLGQGLLHSRIRTPSSITLHAPTLNSNWFANEVVREFDMHYKPLPNKVVLTDYNYEESTDPITVESVVDANGEGDVYEVDYHFKNSSRGQDLADARAEGILARKTRIAGVSDARGFRAGSLFTMYDHFKSELNTIGGTEVKFLIAHVQHHIKQEPAASGGAASSVEYGNCFEAVPADDTTFRPERLTAWPKISGNMTGTIDGASASDQYSDLDDQGRYAVSMPMDLRGNSVDGGNSPSCRVRKSEPYGGGGYGMHFPELPGAEVLISFLNGDPDRPVITGTVSNRDNASVVTSANPTINRISTPAGTLLEMDDTKDAQQVRLQTSPSGGGSPNTSIHMDASAGAEKITIEVPDQKILLDTENNFIKISSSTDSSFIRIGTHDGESSTGKLTSANGLYLSTGGDLNRKVGGDLNTEVTGKENKNVAGTSSSFFLQNAFKVTVGATEDFYFGFKFGMFIGATVDIKAAISLVANASATLEVNKSLKKTLNKDTDYVISGKKIVKKSWGDQELTSGGGNITIESLLKNVDISSGAGKVEISAPMGITLKCGVNKIIIGADGIKLQTGSTKFTMNAATMKLKSTAIDIKATGPLTCKGTPGGQYK